MHVVTFLPTSHSVELGAISHWGNAIVVTQSNRSASGGLNSKLTLNTRETSSKYVAKCTGRGVGETIVSSAPALSTQVGSHDHAHSDQLSERAGSAVFDDVESERTGRPNLIH